jgi:hypothetical protein
MPDDTLDQLAALADDAGAADAGAVNGEAEGFVADPDADPIADRPDLQDAVKGLAKHFMAQELGALRFETRETRRQRLYWRGEQYVYWPAGGNGFAIAPSGGTIRLDSGGAVDMPRYTDVYNIYTPYGESIVSVLAQNPPGIDFQPDDPMKAEDCAAAQLAEKYRHKVDRDNQRKALQAEIARLCWTDNRMVLFTQYVKQSGEDGLGTEKMTAHGSLETKVPITQARVEQWPYAYISDELDVVSAKEEYEDAAAEIKAGASCLGESAYRRIARLGILQGGGTTFSSDSFQHMVTRHHAFLRPAAIDKAPDEFKDELRKAFPDGIHAIFVGDAYCGSKNESMDDCLAVGYPTPGDGASRASLGRRIVPVQDAVNDGMNLMKEAHDYCIPVTYVDLNGMDIDSFRSQVSEPGNNVPMEAKSGMALGDSFFESSIEGVPQTLPGMLDVLMNALPQFQSGALPALMGQGEANNKTKGGIEMLRDSALGRVGLPWGSIQELFARAYFQAIKCAAKHMPDDAEISVSIPGARGMINKESVPIAGLKSGNFRAYPDIDSSFPETTAAKRQVYWSLFTGAEANPPLMETMMLPNNQAEGFRLLGLEDMEIPGAEARQKQLLEIEQLLKTGPIPPTPEEIQAEMQKRALGAKLAQAAGASGMPLPPPPPADEMSVLMALTKPSIGIDPEVDENKYEWEECQRWLNSEERREQERKGNQAGVLNVRLHALEHKQMMQQEMAAMMPPPMPNGKGPGKPPAAPGAQNGLGAPPQL